jgi:hypothetical protein
MTEARRQFAADRGGVLPDLRHRVDVETDAIGRTHMALRRDLHDEGADCGNRQRNSRQQAPEPDAAQRRRDEQAGAYGAVPAHEQGDA